MPAANRMGEMQNSIKKQIGGRTEWQSNDAISAATKHWPEYVIEPACLGLFMVSACSFTVLLEHPASAIRQMRSNQQ